MAGLCKITIIGNLGRDPERRYAQSGTSVTRFSVAATTRKRDKDGNWGDHTEWFNVTTFGARADSLAERLTKGTRVYIEGALELRKYEGQNGPGVSLDVVAADIVVLDARGRGEEGADTFGGSAPMSDRSSSPMGGGASSDESDLEDLPF
jgi:single-strand DNA-binding protein